jgi:hypothetical protein
VQPALIGGQRKRGRLRIRLTWTAALKLSHARSVDRELPPRGPRRRRRDGQSRQTWPANAKADIDAFALELSVESGDDSQVAGDFRIDPSAHSSKGYVRISYNPAASSMATDLSRDNADSNKTTALAQKCRADLGLPPI